MSAKNALKAAYLFARGAALRPFYGPAAAVGAEPVRSILVLRFDRVGDMVLTTPLLAALRDEFPGASIEVLASPANAELLLGDPAVDRVHVMPASGRRRFLAGLKKRGFDLLIDPFWDYDLEWGFVARAVGARRRVGWDIAGRGFFYDVRVPGPPPPLAAPELILELARRGLKRTLTSRPPRIFVTDAERARGLELLRAAGLREEGEIVLLHPGGFYEVQRWPAERFAEAAAALAAPGKRWAALVGGPGDDALLRGKVPIVKTRSLRELAGCLAHAGLFVGNNSGPLHVACAVGTRALSLMGPGTAAEHWTPPAPHETILARETLASIPAAEVVARAEALLRASRTESR